MTGPFVVCCDLDGVVWRGEHALPGAADAVARLRAAGLRVVFLTNNSSATPGDVVARLGAAGVDATPADVAGSAEAAAAVLAGSVGPGATVLTCAGAGVVEACRARGLRTTDVGPADAVVVGWHRDFDFERLRRAADVVRTGVPYVATNLDPTYPASRGLLPGAGALVAAVTAAGGRPPVVAGKPHPPTVELVRERFGTRGVVVGDRPSTDGALAAALGWPFALVLSGIAGSAGEEPVPDPSPAFVAADLAALAGPLVEAFAPDS